MRASEQTPRPPWYARNAILHRLDRRLTHSTCEQPCGQAVGHRRNPLRQLRRRQIAYLLGDNLKKGEKNPPGAGRAGSISKTSSRRLLRRRSHC